MRADFVTICTPPAPHLEIAKACLEAGFHVMCEKPMTRNAAEAEELAACVARTRRVFGLMHPYVGYPTVKLARDLVARGDLGRVAKVVVQYPQGSFRRIDWTKPLTRRQKWQRDPRVHGISGCMSDIGVHAANLLEYVSGLKIREVLSDMARTVRWTTTARRSCAWRRARAGSCSPRRSRPARTMACASACTARRRRSPGARTSRRR